jgi:hypothetical protein
MKLELIKETLDTTIFRTEDGKIIIDFDPYNFSATTITKSDEE